MSSASLLSPCAPPIAAVRRLGVFGFAAPYHKATTTGSNVVKPASESTPAEARRADFSSLDVFGDTPVPSTSVDSCLPGGFRLNNGVQITDGSGVLLVGGEAYAWRPWGRQGALTNAKGQWAVDRNAFGLLSLIWPRPALGMRVEVLDTRNAASQFNLLATERGVDDVAAALIPIGWMDSGRMQ
ncbi:NADH dehydrogenase [Niveomyces insectorum RCEF 264]|uniref:NADH dehydrogenase n=1 Tax=Niveomyces insectorum RCEF 264 TaxID=1081102 RepID=A0A167U0J6_9HYPO|nr:NADH dehydrogenase [Niveomyces insectorum RCEF 264]